jgi:hypothetical protein
MTGKFSLHAQWAPFMVLQDETGCYRVSVFQDADAWSKSM